MVNLKLNGEVIRKVSKVSLRRIADGVLFDVSSACVLKLPEGLVQVVGHQLHGQISQNPYRRSAQKHF